MFYIIFEQNNTNKFFDVKNCLVKGQRFFGSTNSIFVHLFLEKLLYYSCTCLNVNFKGHEYNTAHGYFLFKKEMREKEF